MIRIHAAVAAFAAVLALAPPLSAQQALQEADRASTGGAQTLEDILRRQSGVEVDDDFRRRDTGDPDGAASIANQLGTLGGASDPELWRALRYGSADVSASNSGPGAEFLVQDGGMRWLQWRGGPLREYGGYLLLGTIAALALFFLARGRIRIGGAKTGETITRFSAVERFAHWTLAVSFLLLGATGLMVLFGRVGLLPWMGRDAYAALAVGSKWIHNNVSWAFMGALALVFVLWALRNLPDRTDIGWIAKGGGIVGKSHPPAKKFNAGQKFVFWSVIILGASVSASGLSLLFPFELNMFGPTFAKLNALGVNEWFGRAPYPEALAPHEEMQYAQLWHSIVAFVLMAIVLAHIYIGTVGMEGAFDAMGSGQVEKQWAREHHSLWYEEVAGGAAPKDGADAPAAKGAAPAAE